VGILCGGGGRFNSRAREKMLNGEMILITIQVCMSKAGVADSKAYEYGFFVARRLIGRGPRIGIF